MSKMYLVLDPDHQNAPTAFHVMSHLDKQRYVGGRVTNATRKGRNENRRAEGTVDDAERCLWNPDSGGRAKGSYINDVNKTPSSPSPSISDVIIFVCLWLTLSPPIYADVLSDCPKSVAARRFRRPPRRTARMAAAAFVSPPINKLKTMTNI